MTTTGLALSPDSKQRSNDLEILREVFDMFSRDAKIGKESKSDRIMEKQDFVKALNYVSPVHGLKEEVVVLFQVADCDNKGFLVFSDFVMFHDMLKKPNAEYEIVFRLFDSGRRGKVGLKEIAGNLNTDLTQSQESAEFLELYFGKGKEKKLTFEEFSQLLKGLQEERLRLAFQKYDTEGKGSISANDFCKIIESVASHKLSPFLKDHLQSIAALHVNSGARVSYGVLVAFNNIVKQMDLIKHLIELACDGNKSKQITKQDFIETAAVYTRYSMFTPVEIDILFHFAGLSSSSPGTIDMKKAENLFQKPPFAELEVEQKNNSVNQTDVEHHEHSPSASERILRSAYNFAIGSVAGAIGATVVYPIDLVKTRMQNQRSSLVGELLYKNSFDCFKKVYRNEGFVGLYSGLGPQLVGVAPEKAIKLTMNDLVRSLTKNDDGSIALWAEVLSGSVAGGSQVVFTNPLEIVKIRLQVQGENAKMSGIPRKSAITIVKELGLLGLYKGAGACLLRDIPFSGIYFPVYANVKKHWFGESEKKKLNLVELLASGAIAGMPAAYFTTPADVIKTR
jgi:solute carrier family 25 aspartate/glutamate transporter 12/13